MTTNLPPSSSRTESSAFYLLDERIQRWIWQKGWAELKDIQERAIPIILEGSRDIIITSATASGKTEAAFLPILSRMLSTQAACASALYISPLKALINDQWARLNQLCELIEIPVIPWHGDISETQKKRFFKKPAGCLLITPESLEGLLMRYGHALLGIFGKLFYIVVDELHAFIDTERGKQLQSLMHRIDLALKRSVPRIGLSATLGEIQLAAEFLRPRHGNAVHIIESKDACQELKVIVKGYYDLPPMLNKNEIYEQNKQGLIIKKEDMPSKGIWAISEHLFSTLRGSNNLIFPNSRSKVELYSDLLRRACEKLGIQNEFWPHHGNLSKEIREEAERAIKNGNQPTTIVATTTLELGIDIGAVKSIAQIGPAPSVTSLRQRLGRSGRRKGEPAILRCYCLENEIKSDEPVADQLREGLVQIIAQIRLLVKGWFERPHIQNLHLSTLIQQLLSIIAQYGGVTASQAWIMLCESDVFPKLSKAEFEELLRGLGSKEVISQDSTGLLLHGSLGERLANHYSFFAAFVSSEEFRVVCAGKILGTLPLSRPIDTGSYIIFAGRRWQVVSCCPVKKIIEVEPARGGKPPLFEGMGGKVHDLVREEMRIVLSELSPVPFLDKTALQQLYEARDAYARLELDHKSILQFGNEVHIFSWSGDWINDTLALMLKRKNLLASNQGLTVVVFDTDIDHVLGVLSEIGKEQPPRPEELAESVKNKLREKWDRLLTDELLCKTFASRDLDVVGAIQFAIKVSNLL